MRGSGTERSSRITLMEDGVLMAPAPYSGSVGLLLPYNRAWRVEVRKGGAKSRLVLKLQERTQPRVASIPDQRSPAACVSKRAVSKTSKCMLLLVERKANGDNRVHAVVQQRLQNLDTGGDTGFDKTDVVASSNGRRHRASTRCGSRVRSLENRPGNLPRIGPARLCSESVPSLCGLGQGSHAHRPFPRHCGTRIQANGALVHDHGNVPDVVCPQLVQIGPRSGFHRGQLASATFWRETMSEALGWLRGASTAPALALTSKPTTGNRRTGHPVSRSLVLWRVPTTSFDLRCACP